MVGGVVLCVGGVVLRVGVDAGLCVVLAGLRVGLCEGEVVGGDVECVGVRVGVGGLVVGGEVDGGLVAEEESGGWTCPGSVAGGGGDDAGGPSNRTCVTGTSSACVRTRRSIAAPTPTHKAVHADRTTTESVTRRMISPSTRPVDTPDRNSIAARPRARRNSGDDHRGFRRCRPRALRRGISRISRRIPPPPPPPHRPTREPRPGRRAAPIKGPPTRRRTRGRVPGRGRSRRGRRGTPRPG